jgi:hypothetical protein
MLIFQQKSPSPGYSIFFYWIVSMVAERGKKVKGSVFQLFGRYIRQDNGPRGMQDEPLRAPPPAPYG